MKRSTKIFILLAAMVITATCCYLTRDSFKFHWIGKAIPLFTLILLAFQLFVLKKEEKAIIGLLLHGLTTTLIIGLSLLY